MVLFSVLGLILLIAGAEALVRGASRLAATVGLSPLVIGLTVVAFGTSAPELAVSVGASLAGRTDIAVGNVVGSNIFNVLFILGLSALIAPLTVARQLVRLDVPLVIVISGLVLLLGLDGRIGRLEGALLFAGLLGYLAFLLRAGQGDAPAGDRAAARRAWPLDALLVVAGLAMLILGSRWLVAGATQLAAQFGVSELVIGLTVVAAGTSLPEVVTSVVASLRGERDIAVGNVVGSNLFNLLGVLGLSAVAAPDGLLVSPAARHFDLPIMLVAAFACLPIFFTGYRIARWEGALFLGYYAAYTVYLLLAATQHDALGPFSQAMLFFALPLTAITLALLAGRALRRHRQ
jgi:cation:H+ antiporter